MNEKRRHYYKMGIDFGRVCIEVWKSLPNDAKKGIKEKIDVHHGEIGGIAALIGYILEGLSETEQVEFLKGFGETLMIDDIRDLGKWFKPR